MHTSFNRGFLIKEKNRRESGSSKGLSLRKGVYNEEVFLAKEMYL